MKLHLGCGKNPREGWVNIDSVDLPGVDVVADLDALDTAPLPFEDNSVEESEGIHVMEHLRNPLTFMQDLWRVTKPGGTVLFATPYGSSDDAWEDPTHVRPYFVGSWHVFQQPYYWRASYGYTADWQVETIWLRMDGRRWGAQVRTPEQLFYAVMTERNIVIEMRAQLRAVKPARPSDQRYQQQGDIKFDFI